MASSQRATDATADEITQVLEFGLGEETSCLDIGYIHESSTRPT